MPRSRIFTPTNPLALFPQSPLCTPVPASTTPSPLSATFPEEVQRVAKQFLKNEYMFVAVGVVGAAQTDVTQIVEEVPYRSKTDRVKEILQSNGTCLGHKECVTIQRPLFQAPPPLHDSILLCTFLIQFFSHKFWQLKFSGISPNGYSYPYFRGIIGFILKKTGYYPLLNYPLPLLHPFQSPLFRRSKIQDSDIREDEETS